MSTIIIYVNLTIVIFSSDEHEEPPDIVDPPQHLTSSLCKSTTDCDYETFDGVKFKYCSACTVTMLRSSRITIRSQTECHPYENCICWKVNQICMIGDSSR